ncbi:MAG: UvrD-helicase domain-containing protein [Candidatus Omnitrophica bacterium]|nr:UvrD-helicase domain-containing protein [Candidatus Omnitrophota bacterium]
MPALLEDKLLEGLNEKQTEAVTHGEGPLLIIAGAGTGKTSVITRRIAYLIATKQARPEEILALTFTEKAASEMEERVDLLVPYGYTETWISTFHAFGDRILRECALEIGLSPDFQVLTKPEQIIFFREHLFELPLEYYRPLSDPTKFIDALLTVISRAKDEDIGPKAYLDYAESLRKKAKKDPKDPVLKEESQKTLEIAKLYEAYQKLLLKEGKIDFGNQVYLTLELFRKRPSVLKRYRERFKYILIDEFQDTNFSQFQLVKLLAASKNNITVCGDDDQSIYKFRGAAISNILGFLDHYPKAAQVVLTRNYRSTQRILDQAYRLIRYNNPDRLEVRSQVDKRLQGEPGGSAVEHWHFDTVSTEADEVARFIEERAQKGEMNYEDFAILVRSNNDADPFLRALNMHNIPWRFTGNQGLYQREEVRIAISFLRLMADVHDSLSLFHLMSSEIWMFDMLILNQLSTLSHKRNRSLSSVLKELPSLELEGLTQEHRLAGGKIVEALDAYLRKSRTLTTGQLLYDFLKGSGYLSKLSREETVASDAKLQNLARFFELVRNFETLSKEDRVNRFVTHLDMLMEAGDDPAVVEAELDLPAVNVLTVHKAKGLEFEGVILVGLVMGRFPWPRRRDPIELPEPLVQEILPVGDFHLQEERRLFYVGMTRAKRELILTSSLDYGGKTTRKVSQFILEALDLPKESVSLRKSSPLEVLDRSAVKGSSAEGTLRKIGEEELLTLSHYQVDDYLSCPLKYKYVHILRIPVTQHHTVIYGRAIHAAVEAYYRARLEKQPFTEEELVKTFEETWASEGFLSREHEERRLATGREVLHRFYLEESKKNLLPTAVEKEFGFVLGKDKMIGRWDLIYETKEEVVIADVKTSEIRTQERADERAKESLQLSIYTLAYKEIFGRLPDRVELRFLESGLRGNSTRTEKALEETVDKIKEASQGIRAREFTPKPAYQVCRYCAYREICPYAVRG